MEKRPESNKVYNGVPSDLLPRLRKLVDDPFAWWTGQFQKFFLKPDPTIKTKIENIANKISSVSPLIGVYDRQTVSDFPLDYYMEYVNEYYDLLEMTDEKVKRNVLLITSLPNILKEAQKKYPKNRFYTNEIHASTKDDVIEFGTRTFTDLELLSKCEYIVISDSTKFSRTVYEMMSSRYVDAYDRVVSLDEVYHTNAYEMHFRHISNTVNLTFNESVTLTDSRNMIRTGMVEISNSEGKKVWVPEFKITQLFDSINAPTYGIKL